MIWCDYMIEDGLRNHDIHIQRYFEEQLQPNSYDVCIGDEIISDISQGEMIKHKLPYTFKHGEFILATTNEYIEINSSCCCMIDGKSTPARHGICVHLTAGFIDCGFRGNITLEMVNFGRDLVLEKGMKIGQLVFFESPTPEHPYNGHYQNQKGVTPAWDV